MATMTEYEGDVPMNADAVVSGNEERKQISDHDKKLCRNIVSDKLNKYVSYYSPWEMSPDGTKIALAVLERKRNVSYEVVVIDLETRNIIFRKNFGKEYIGDITWEPDSKSLAVIIKSSKTGLMPWELLAMVAGHSIPYYTFNLEVLDIGNNASVRYPLAKKVRYGSGYVYWSNNCIQGDK